MKFIMKFPVSIASIWILLSLLECQWITSYAATRLSDYISHYESLSYDTQHVQQAHQRSRRSTDDVPVRISFRAHQRVFKLVLRRDDSTFVNHPEEVLSDGTVLPLDVSHIYKGHLEGEPKSYVHGSIIEGMFAGRIETPTETFYVDKTETHFRGPQPFHSVIYNDRDIDPSPRIKRSSDDAHSESCGISSTDVYKWMESVRHSAVESSVPNHKKQWKYENVANSDHEDFINRYSQYHNSKVPPQSTRQRRGVTNSGQNRMCALLLQSDPMLWDYMTRSNEKVGLGYSTTRAREEITALFAYHVDGIKKIYSSTAFQYANVGPYGGFTFAVHRIQINTTEGCNTSNSDNPFCKQNIDVSNFLNLNSLTDHDLYCLAYVFTYRDFSQGTLGLAWVGSNLKASGGLCERWKEYNENNRRVYKSLNTGIVTLVNYGTRVPPKVSTLTFAHEIGHNFGSPHDSGTDCVPLQANPNDPHGNYIMYASATSGDRQNNYKFSTCSIGNMTQVLHAVLGEMNGKHNCFVSSQEAFCGNRIVEAGEECDCGFEEDCNDPAHRDPCCYPRNDVTRHCQRRENASCSPSEGPCCHVVPGGNTCYFVQPSKSECRAATECSEAVHCNGISAKCPDALPKVDKSLCNGKTQVCMKGECTGSVCSKIGWEQCYPTAPPDESNFNRGQLCYVACYNQATKECVSTGSDDVKKPENKALLDFLHAEAEFIGIRLPAGAPCDNFNGYCDVFQKCRAVNEDGPLARLKNLLFNQQTFNTIKDWITEYWWAVLLMCLGLIVLMAMFIKVCAVHTPSSNPNLPPAQKLTLPRRHTHRAPQAQPPPYTTDQVPRPAAVVGGPPQGKRRSRPAAGASTSSAGPSSRPLRQQQPQPAQHFTELELMPSKPHGQRRGQRRTNTQQV